MVEIIDHHRLGAITTLRPIRFFNDPVGATCTIIAMKFIEAGLTPSREIAGVLLCGILSDTLSLRMSTTTHQDKKAVKWLASLTGEDPEKLGVALLEAGMDLFRRAARYSPFPRHQDLHTLGKERADRAGDGAGICVEPVP